MVRGRATVRRDSPSTHGERLTECVAEHGYAGRNFSSSPLTPTLCWEREQVGPYLGVCSALSSIRSLFVGGRALPEKPLSAQVIENGGCVFFGAEADRVEAEFRGEGRLIGVVDAGEALD